MTQHPPTLDLHRTLRALMDASANCTDPVEAKRISERVKGVKEALRELDAADDIDRLQAQNKMLRFALRECVTKYVPRDAETRYRDLLD